MAQGNWSNAYGALGGGKPSTGDLRQFGGPGASTSGGGFLGGLGKLAAGLGNFGSGGGGNMWGALIGAGVSGFFADRAAGRRANTDMRLAEATDRRWNQQVIENRGIGKLKIANALWQDAANNRMADNNLERQKDAALFGARILSPWENAAAVNKAERLTAFALSEDATEQRRRQNISALGANLLNKRAVHAGLFGENIYHQMDRQNARA